MLRLVPRNRSLIRLVGTMVVVLVVAFQAGCTQTRSRGWAQFSPIIEANPSDSDVEAQTSLGARADREEAPDRSAGDYTQ